MDFFLFLLVNFTLFIRPSEIIAGLEVVPVYNILMVAGMSVAAPRMVELFRPDRLARQPITVCVFGVWCAVVLSQAVRGEFWYARDYGIEFGKSVLYYVLLVTVVNSIDRLRKFLYAVSLFAAFGATIAILDYYDYIDIPTLTTADEPYYDPVSGQEVMLRRLCSTGIFGDPNDLSMIAVMGIVAGFYALGDKRLGILRIAWAVPMAILFATVVLTYSRGGMLALLAALGVLSYYRFGRWTTAVAALFVVPLVFLLGGRQADLSTAFSGGTGAGRVMIWANAMSVLKQSPLFGVGYENHAEAVGAAAHNSYLHAFVELGLVGGPMFFGVCYFSVLSLVRLWRRTRSQFQYLSTDELQRLQLYMLAILAGCLISMFSLSRTYIIPTYMVFGIVNICCIEAWRRGIPPVVRLTPGTFLALYPQSVAFLAFMYIYIRVSPH